MWNRDGKIWYSEEEYNELLEKCNSLANEVEALKEKIKTRTNLVKNC